MKITKLINQLEQISLKIPTKILRIKGHVFEGGKQYLEIIIFRGFSSSTTHAIETDLEKNVIRFDFNLEKAELLNSPLSSLDNRVIRESNNLEEFLDENNWL